MAKWHLARGPSENHSIFTKDPNDVKRRREEIARGLMEDRPDQGSMALEEEVEEEEEEERGGGSEGRRSG